MINVGILGAGGIARTHVRGYAQLPNTRVVAVCDIIPERAETMAASLAARPYTDWAAFLAHPGMDMVDICLPTYLHDQGVIAAAGAGKHVLCEKPVTLTIEQADRMIAAVDRAGVKAMVAQVIRFWPHYSAIKDMLERGELGAPLVARLARLGTLPAWGSWYRDPALSGGALLDLHVHDLDWVYYLFGAPRTVYAVGVQSDTSAWNDLTTSLDYGDHKAVVEASLLMPAGFPFTMHCRVLGANACAEYRYGGGQVDPQGAARLHSLAIYRGGGAPAEDVPCSAEDPYMAEIRYFVGCLEAGVEPAIATLRDARAVLGTALAARRSLETGSVISINDAP